MSESAGWSLPEEKFARRFPEAASDAFSDVGGQTVYPPCYIPERLAFDTALNSVRNNSLFTILSNLNDRLARVEKVEQNPEWYSGVDKFIDRADKELDTLRRSVMPKPGRIREMTSEEMDQYKAFTIAPPLYGTSPAKKSDALIWNMCRAIALHVNNGDEPFGRDPKEHYQKAIELMRSYLDGRENGK